MTPRLYFHIAAMLALCISTAIAADEPRLLPTEVSRTAAAAARQQGYDLESYTRGEPSYDSIGRTWGVNYLLKSSHPQAGGKGVLTVQISDATGFASTRFWLAAPTPSGPVGRPFSLEVVFASLYTACGVLLAFAPFDRKHTRSRWARASFALVALIFVFVGASELLRFYGIWTLSQQMERGFSHALNSLGGIAIGLLLALGFSGELAGRAPDAEGPNQPMQPTADRPNA